MGRVTSAYVGIGSNVGDRVDFCRRAVELLASTEGIEIDRVSSIYETSPIGGPPQRSFINCVVRVRTTLSARELLAACQAAEQVLGREPSEMRWGPRVADLDVLLYGDEKINESDLEVPHPRMTQRRFVLVPLLEIDPDATDPWGKRLADWLDQAEGEIEARGPFDDPSIS